VKEKIMNDKYSRDLQL